MKRFLKSLCKSILGIEQSNNRHKYALKHIQPKKLGLEIGPCHKGLAPKRAGYHVHIMDHLNQQQLLEKYRDHNIDMNAIESVDFVWHGEPFLELVGKNRYDWVIASHVIEHTPDLIRFLQDCQSILTHEGVLSLVIPDKRYCFDAFRPVTGLARVIDSHYSGNTIHSAGSVAEYFLNVAQLGQQISWQAGHRGNWQLIHDMPAAQHGIRAVIEEKAYLDVHAWCFTPHSFRLLIHDLYHLGYIQLKELDYHTAIGCEFYITLSATGAGMKEDRIVILKKIEQELADMLYQYR